MHSDIDSVRRLSSAVCGARYRLEILYAIAKTGTFTATELITELWKAEAPPAQSIVSAELKRLREFGLIRREEGNPSNKSIPLVAADSDVWAAVISLAEAA